MIKKEIDNYSFYRGLGEYTSENVNKRFNHFINEYKNVTFRNIIIPCHSELSIESPDSHIEFDEIDEKNITLKKVIVKNLVIGSEFKQPILNLDTHLDIHTLHIKGKAEGLNEIRISPSKGNIKNIEIDFTRSEATPNLFISSVITNIYLRSGLQITNIERAILGNIASVFQYPESLCIKNSSFINSFSTTISSREIFIEDCFLNDNISLTRGNTETIEITNLLTEKKEAQPCLYFSDISIERLLKIEKTIGIDVKFDRITSPALKIGHLENSALSFLSYNFVTKTELSKSSLTTLKITGNIQAVNNSTDLKIANCSIGSMEIVRTETAKLSILDSRIGSFDASNTSFRNSTYFKDCVFETAPLFYHAELYPDVDFSTCTFSNTGAESEGPYRKLKHLMQGIENDRDATLFSGLELQSHMSGLVFCDHPFKKLLGSIYLITNNYGRSLTRPFYSLGIIFILGIIAFFFSDLAYTPPTLSHPYFDTWYHDVSKFSEFWYPIIYSFFNSLGPLRLITDLNIFTPVTWWGATTAWIQILLSSFLWYLIIIGIRRYFRST